MELKLWPWEQDNAKPYFVDNDIEWWVDKSLTDWATRTDYVNKSSMPLKAICFITRKKNGEVMERVLVGEKQKILAIDTNYEQMACKIDILRLKF